MMRHAGWKAAVLAAACVLAAAPALRADNLSCLICHEALHGEFQTRSGLRTSLYVDGAAYAASVHQFLECTDCHQKYRDNPHGSVEEGIDPSLLALAAELERKSPIDPVAQAACIQCHEDVYTAVRASVHGINLFEKKETDGAYCLDCHGSPHTIVPASESTGGGGPVSPVSYERVVETCGHCHDQKGISLKYGLSTQIMERYRESFHGKKYHLGARNVPVCTTCHGSHAVRS